LAGVRKWIAGNLELQINEDTGVLKYQDLASTRTVKEWQPELREVRITDSSESWKY
jgi:hypothetical protein